MAKLSDCEAEAAETQTWKEFAVESDYLDRAIARTLYKTYDEIIGTFVGMIVHSDKWILTKR